MRTHLLQSVCPGLGRAARQCRPAGLRPARPDLACGAPVPRRLRPALPDLARGGAQVHPARAVAGAGRGGGERARGVRGHPGRARAHRRALPRPSAAPPRAPGDTRPRSCPCISKLVFTTLLLRSALPLFRVTAIGLFRAGLDSALDGSREALSLGVAVAPSEGAPSTSHRVAAKRPQHANVQAILHCLVHAQPTASGRACAVMKKAEGSSAARRRARRC